MSDYINKLVQELEDSGITLPTSNITKEEDRDLKVILDMQRAQNITYSDEQRKILNHRGNVCIIACAGSGKALKNGTGVLTPDGYKPIETLSLGDIVFDERGNQQIVLGVYPQGKKQVWKVQFEDNITISCCKDHLWTFYDSFLNRWRTETLEYIYEHFNDCFPFENGKTNILRIPALTHYEHEYMNMTTYDRDRATGFWDKYINRNIDITEGLPKDLKLSKTFGYLIGEILCKYGDTGFRYYKEEEKFIDDLVTNLEFVGYHVIKNISDCRLTCKKRNYLQVNGLNTTNIIDITKTSDYAEMTCIKVSGISELFLTEHCIVTHNTTTLINLLAKRILTGEIADTSKLICTTYSKKSADDMNSRLNSLLSLLGINKKVEVKTLHAFFLNVIRTFGVNSGVIENSKRNTFIKEACKESGYKLKDDDLSIISNLLSYQVNNLLSDKKTLDSTPNTIDELELEQYSSIRKKYAEKKIANNLIDYDDMQTYLYLWLNKWCKSDNESEREMSKSVIQYCKSMWTDFYIDEAQDTSKLQFNIIKALVMNIDKTRLDKNLVFIGDDDQCIYQWRGSDPSMILSAGALFDMPVFMLNTNYRCYSNILDYASTGIQCNTGRYAKNMQSFNSGGSVKFCLSNKTDMCNLSIAAVSKIKEWIEGGHKPQDIAVLSRNNFHLAILSNMLLREGIYCDMSDDMKLTKSYMYKDIKYLIDLCDTSWKPEVTRNILWKLVRYLSRTTASVIANFQDISALSLQDTLSYIVKYIFNVNIDFDKKLKIPNDVYTKISKSLLVIAPDSKEDIKLLQAILTSGTMANKLEALTSQYYSVTSNYIYKLKDNSRAIFGLVLYINNLLKKDGFNKMVDFLRVTEQLEHGRMAIPGPKVTLSTIHGAKGREWKNVIMFACDNISMPNFDKLYFMQQTEASVHEMYEYIDEERRLFYVGNTRAKENLFIITNPVPSIFIYEALGMFKDKTGGNNDTILELVNKGFNHDYTDFLNDRLKIDGDKNEYSLNNEDKLNEKQ